MVGGAGCPRGTLTSLVQELRSEQPTDQASSEVVLSRWPQCQGVLEKGAWRGRLLPSLSSPQGAWRIGEGS